MIPAVVWKLRVRKLVWRVRHRSYHWLLWLFARNLR